MSIKKSTVAVSILFLFTGIFSCTDCGPFPDKSRVLDVISNMYQIDLSNNINLNEIENNSVKYDELALEIVPVIENYFSLIKKLNSFKLTQSAYACSPVPPEMVDKIINIEIFSDKDYNISHPANTDLKDIINIKLPLSIIQEYTLTEFIDSNPVFPNSMLLLFNEAPNTNQTHQITVKIYTDGAKLNYKEIVFEPVEIRLN